METITVTPQIVEPKNLLKDYFIRCAERRKPRGGASLKQAYKREMLKEKGFTFDL